MFSDAPPWRDDVTTSLTCPLSVVVNTFTNSGMIAPASVPQVMIVDSFHHNVASPASARDQGIDTPKVRATDTDRGRPDEACSGAS